MPTTVKTKENPMPHAWNPYDQHTCWDCGVPEGHLHQWGCCLECCPFCGGQLLGCRCCYTHLRLVDRERCPSATGSLPPAGSRPALTDAQVDAWCALLETQGRVPFLVYPHLCARCGATFPKMFTVPTVVWDHYIQLDQRGQMLCFPCFQCIVHLIDAGRKATH